MPVLSSIAVTCRLFPNGDIGSGKQYDAALEKFRLALHAADKAAKANGKQPESVAIKQEKEDSGDAQATTGSKKIKKKRSPKNKGTSPRMLRWASLRSSSHAPLSLGDTEAYSLVIACVHVQGDDVHLCDVPVV